jgi:hypothetical protein
VGRTTSLKLLNTEFGHPKAQLISPTNRGYLDIGAALQSGPTTVLLPSGRRASLLTHLKRSRLAAQVRRGRRRRGRLSGDRDATHRTIQPALETEARLGPGG